MLNKTKIIVLAPLISFLILGCTGPVDEKISCTTNDTYDDKTSIPTFGAIVSHGMFKSTIRFDIFEDAKSCDKNNFIVFCSRKEDGQSIRLNQVTGEFTMVNYKKIGRGPVILSGTCKKVN